MSTSLIVRSSTSVTETASALEGTSGLSRFANAAPQRLFPWSSWPRRPPCAGALFEDRRSIRGYIYVPHHNFISRGPSHGRGIYDGFTAWAPHIWGTDVLPAAARRDAHTPERVRAERPRTDCDLPRDPVPTREFGSERSRARALPRNLRRHARCTRQLGRGTWLEAHHGHAEPRAPRVGGCPPPLHAVRLRVDLSRFIKGLGSQPRTLAQRSPSCASTESYPSRRLRRRLLCSPLPCRRRDRGRRLQSPGLRPAIGAPSQRSQLCHQLK